MTRYWATRRAAAVCLVVFALFPARVNAAASGWAVVGSPNVLVHHGELVSVSCPAVTACVAVGDFVNGGGVRVPLVEGWNGSAWTIQSTPIITSEQAQLSAVSCATTTSCTAVGSYTNLWGRQITLAEQWNGTSWTVAMPPNPPGVYVVLSAVSCAAASSCIAVGGYVAPKTFAYTSLAEAWNGSAWSILPAPKPSPSGNDALSGVSCTASITCTAVGWANFQQSPLAESWDGSAWSLQPSPSPNGASGATLSGVVCLTAAACTAAGRYQDSASGTGRTLVERWDGTAWTVAPTPNAPGVSNSSLSGVSCADASDCAAVGASDNGSVAERWNGSAWTIQPTDALGGALLSPACAAANGCIAVGSYGAATGQQPLAEHEGGSGWTADLTPSPVGTPGSDLSGVACTSATACVAVGEGFVLGTFGPPAALTEIWNGRKWTIRPTPVPVGSSQSSLSSVSCASATLCLAVGNYRDASNSGSTFAEQWNGSAWSVQHIPNPPGATDSSLASVACASSTVCMAVGTSSADHFNSAVTLAESWNGSTWTVVTTPNQSGAPVNALLGVACPAVTWCEAVGTSSSSAYVPGAPLAEAWDGTSWSLQTVPAGSGHGSLNAVSCPGIGVCEAAGTQSDGAATLAEKWDGTAWQVQSTPTPSGAATARLLGMACSGVSSCTAVGYSARSIPGRRVTLAERWDGMSWTSEPSPNLPGTDADELAGVACPLDSFCASVGAVDRNLGDASGNGTPTTLAENRSG